MEQANASDGHMDDQPTSVDRLVCRFPAFPHG